ncbi:hypothetical protein Poli38472_007377 [Pythium oligandrum]|uniref:Haloacid dehalogenase-like hydrolase n=1 Tax=Pythium oligandrum TaxID=41045 RepID=A0A8K1CB91_PYTOL|nr:hypothetical protein Poli38472_007377 [Pythium oligandrum]|eukprot:TMW59232.1 hypothetical protein Poli38472_007377 [Pythium oligandrum]
MTTRLVQGATFDLDDTLWCGMKVIRKASDAFHAFIEARSPALAAAFPPQEFTRLMGQFQSDPELVDKAHDYTFLRKHTLRHCLTNLDATALALEDEEAFLEEAFQAFLVPRSKPELFDGVEELLNDLHTHLSAARKHALADSTTADAPLMGVITNGNCSTEFLPLYFNQHLRFFVSAESAGCAKPARVIFDAALAYFPPSMDPSEIVHVGDHYEYDVVGAKDVGMRTIWVNAKWPGDDVYSRDEMDAATAEKYPAADAIVRHVSAVSNVVQRWNDAVTKN